MTRQKMHSKTLSKKPTDLDKQLKSATFSIYQSPLVSKFEHLVDVLDRELEAAGPVNSSKYEQASTRLRLWSNDICGFSTLEDVLPSQVLQVVYDDQPEANLVKDVERCFSDIIIDLEKLDGRMSRDQSSYDQRLDQVEDDDGNFLTPFNKLSTCVPEIRNTYQSVIKKQARQGKVVLSLDGGGIRSYSSLLLLEALMRQVRIVYKNDHPNLPKEDDDTAMNFLPREHFDYIFGTSSGGLLAIMLGRLRMPIKQCLQAFTHYAEEVFDHPSFQLRISAPRYKSDIAERAIKELVGNMELDPSQPWKRDVFALDGDPCRTAVLAIRSSPSAVDELQLFRSYASLTAGPLSGPEAEVPIWAIARAILAAPSYFAPMVINGATYSDGGVRYNNPSWVAHEEVVSVESNYDQGHDYPISVMISIGTGAREPFSRLTSFGLGIDARKPFSRSKSFGFGSGTRESLARSKSFGFGTSIFSVRRKSLKISTDTESTHLQLKALEKASRHHPQSKGMQYYRLNVDDGLQNIYLDDNRSAGIISRLLGRPKTRQTLEEIHRATTRYLEKEETKSLLLSAARALISSKRARNLAPIIPLPPSKLQDEKQQDEIQQSDEALLARLRKELAEKPEK